jgi:hypothetical protein
MDREPMSQRTLARSFASGELTPELFGRLDLGKFQSGLATCRNFVVLPHGPVANRPGTEYVLEVKDSTKRTRLIPFTYSVDQTMAIEVGAGYFRFHTQGATLLDGAAPYEVANPYAEADLFDIHYVQSADVLTLAHPKYPVQELRRLRPGRVAADGADLSSADQCADWGSGDSASGTGSTRIPVRRHRSEPGKPRGEHVASAASVPVTNDLTLAGRYKRITWTAPATGDIVRYNVYKLANGLYGFIGQCDGPVFHRQQHHGRRVDPRRR